MLLVENLKGNPCNFYRDILGPQLVFINLTMNDKDRNQRVLERHEGDEKSVEIFEVDFCHWLRIKQIFLFFNNRSSLKMW